MMMIMAAVILINANGGGAAVLVKSNSSYGCISGREEECLIAEDMELEHLFMEYGSHVVRVLQATPQTTTQGSNDGSVTPCNNGPGKPYKCKPDPGPNPSGSCHPPSPFKRGCH
ncbi:hypothetical protein TIFTF001_033102 [Ficus carica]|uniref:Uncharacterized protein n=1 Tax=Ficus carica TaxID=3494 RepID=A0AA88J8S0_FICCA|nr:hypothetical protein TIFTF001_033102 [Ficus carica]